MCHIKEITSDKNFYEVWTEIKKTECEEFEFFDDNYLDNHKVCNYKQFVHQMLKPAE
jgi:hypothetical protein